MNRVFEIEIKENIEVVIDSRFKIKPLIEFIRLSFNRLEINDDNYFIYFDKNNIQKHKLLLQTLVNLHKKIYKDTTISKRIALNYRKNILIQIKKYNLYQSNIINIEIKKLSSKEFSITFSNPIKTIYNYIKGLFLFYILELNENSIIVSFNETAKEVVFDLSKKSAIMGYKINFIIDENDFKFSHRKHTIEGNLKEYLAKIRNALDLFGVDSIYEFDTIKRRYKRYAKKYHPDLHHNTPDLIQKIYQKKFLKIKESYELLEEYYKNKNGF